MIERPAPRLLVVDDDRAFRLSTAALLRADGFRVDVAESGAAGVELLRAAAAGGDGHDLVLLDVRMPGVDGLGVVEALRRWGEAVPILMISGVGTVESAVRALHLGADDFLTKPVEPDTLIGRVRDILERRPRIGHADDAPVSSIVGRSRAVRALLDTLRQVAPTDATVLVTGETGTGKELVAHALHAASTRRGRPFVVVNCAGLAEGVLESELFGHVRGAFTGALRDRAGAFEAAHGGTLFLDEIGDIGPGFQQRLLRVLQEREVTRVGATRAEPVDVRVVAATHRDLRARVASGEFREDLYYRLNVFPLVVPPLRERAEDVPLLVEHFLTQQAARRDGPRRGRADRAATLGTFAAGCSPLAMRLLQRHPWPGNVRELSAAVASALIRSGGARIEAQHLPPEIREAPAGPRYHAATPAPDERATILDALAQTGYTLGLTAQRLGMGRTTLWRKMKAYGIRLPDPPAGEA